jgi:uncharacterized delta-60 repeat protein
LTPGTDGNLYGTTEQGGTNGIGVFFRASSTGAYTPLYPFSSASGFEPFDGVTLGADGSFFGTAYAGGANGSGSLFRTTTNGTLTTLASFDGSALTFPTARPVFGNDGNLYGTSPNGGAGYGAIYRATTNGVLSTIATFGNTNGASPQCRLLLAPDGSFYGTTWQGGSSSNGTVFRVTTNGVLSSLVSFSGTNGAFLGAQPNAVLALGPDGRLYGTTYQGGLYGRGTVFRVSTNGTFASLVSLNVTNGAFPYGYGAGLNWGNDGNFYGATFNGGTLNSGTLFKFNTNGVLTTLCTFAGTNGSSPMSSPMLASDGALYGTTYSGGFNRGVIYVFRYPLAITNQPQSQTNSSGTTASFMVTATGTPYPAYQWRKGGTNLSDGGNVAGSGSPTLTITNVQTGDAGNYDVLVTNNFGSVTSAVAALTVVAPPGITAQPQSQTNVSGTLAQFSVGASGTAPLAYRWRKGGGSLSDVGNLGGSGTATLSITNAQSNDAGNYDVVVTNSYGSTTSAVAVLTVLGPPVITIQPGSHTNLAGTITGFGVAAAGVQPLSFHWRKDGLDLSADSNLVPTDSQTASTLYGYVQASDAGNYDIVVTNSYGSVTSAVATLTVLVPASIGSQPQSQTNIAGTLTQFGVGASGTAPLSYRWRKGGTNLSDGGTLGGSGTPTLFITNSQPGDAGNYDVVVTNAYAGVTSSVAALTIWVLPTISVQPTPQTVPLYGNPTFSVTAAGTAPLAYQWRKGVLDIPSATASSLVLSHVQYSDAGLYSVRVTNVAGSVVSSNATLTVTTPQPGDLDLSFSGPASMSGSVVCVGIQPDGKFVVGGSFTNVNGSSRNSIARLNSDGSNDATFLNGLAGANGTIRTLAIQIDGKIVIGGEFTTVNGVARGRIARLNTDGTLDTGFQNGLAGANDAVYSLALQSDGKVVIGGPFIQVNGTGRSCVARLNTNGSLDTGFLNGLAGADNTLISLALQSNGQVVIGGAFANVNGVARGGIARLNADGSLDTSFQNGSAGANGYVYSTAIQKDGKVLIGGDFTTVNGSTRTRLTRLNSNGGLDTGFGTSTGANGIVWTIAQLADATVLAGGDFTSVNGTTRNRFARLDTSGGVDSTFQNGMSGANNTVYAQAQQTDGQIVIGGAFTNVNGFAVQKFARLWEQAAASPMITLQPQSQTNTAGSTANFIVGAAGTVPLTYQWRKGGQNLNDGGNLSGASSSSLVISNLNTDAGGYDVVVTNVYGSITSSVATLTVVFPPTIDTQPQSQTNFTWTQVLFTVGASGPGPLGYAWRKNGLLLSDTTYVSGSASATLSVTNLQFGDAGNYDVIVTNTFGSVTSAVAVLTVIGPPIIGTSPQSRTNLAGTAAGFAVVASGTPPLSYRWRKEGLDLPVGSGLIASGSTLFGPVQAGDAGNYDVVVTNNYGSVTSAVAALTVVSPPSIGVPPQSQTNLAGTLAQFSVGASGTAPLVYRWRKGGTNLIDGGNLNGSGTAMLSVSGVQASDAGSYDVVVTNNYGSITSTVAMLVIAQPPSIGSQPQSLTNALGTPASFSVGALGTAPLSYQWRKGGTNLSDGPHMVGTSSASLSITNVYVVDAGGYDVVVTNNFGSVTSTVATLTVVVQPLRITNVLATATSELTSYNRLAAYMVDGQFDPSNNLVNAAGVWESAGIGFGGPVNDYAPMALFDLNDLYTVQQIRIWNFPEPQPAIRDFVLEYSNDGANYAQLSLVTNLSQTAETDVAITIPNVRFLRFRILDNWGGSSYPVTPGNPPGGFDGFVGLAEVAFFGVSTVSLGPTPPMLEVQPKGRTIVAGDTATLAVAAAGSQPLSYRWRKGGMQLSDSANLSGSGTNILSITNSQVSDSGGYDVVITNSFGSVTSQVAVLNVSTNGLLRGLLLYLPFDGDASDASGNGRDGIVQGAVLTTNRFGQSGTAYSFNGSSYIQVINLDPDNYTNGFSFGSWVNPQTTGGWLYWNYDGGWGSTFVQLDGSLHFRVGTGDPATDHTLSSSLVPLNQWTHLIVTHNPTNDSLYVNSQQIGQWPSHLMQGNVNYLRVGQGYGFGGFSGSVDDVVVYGRELSATEVSSLYTNGVVGTPPSPPSISIQPPTLGAGILSINLSGSPGSAWSVERAPFMSGPWTNVGSITLDTNGVGLFQDTHPPAAAGFYRLYSR